MLAAAAVRGMEQWEPSPAQQLCLAAELDELAATDPEHPLLCATTYRRWKAHLDTKMEKAAPPEADTPGGRGG